MNKAFQEAMAAGYELAEPSITIGGAMHDGELVAQPHVAVALSMLNRHGLVAGGRARARRRPSS